MQVIDALVVTLGLDSKDFEKGRKNVDASLEKTKKSTEKTGKDIAASGKQGAEFFGQMQKAALKFFAVIAAARGLTQFVSNTITLGANLSRTGRNLDISADKLQKWGNAVKQNGGTLEGFLGTLNGVSQQLTQQLMTGESQMSELLYKLGVGVADGAGKAKDELQLLLDVAGALEQKDWARQDKFNMLVGSGLADAGLANVLLLGRQGAEDLISKQVGMSDEMAKKLEEQEKRWIAIQQRIKDIGVTLFEKILGPLENISKTLDEMFTSSNTAKFAENFGKMAKFAKDTAKYIGDAVDSYERIANKLGLSSKSSSGRSEPELIKLAKSGDRGASEELARMQLEGSWYHKLKGGYTEKDLQERIAQLTYSQSSNPSPTIDSPSSSLQDKIAAAERANGLPSGLISSIIKQETGGRKEFMQDPAKYHYELNSEGRRIAPHTGKVSTAFGPFGILESTAKDPGYGVSPLQNKSFDEQLRFMSEYIAARSKYSGGLFGGLSGYGEGEKYANQVLGRIPDITGGGVMSGVSGAGAGRGNVNITNGQIIINTQATDAQGIARDFNSVMVQQANSGMR